MGIEGIPISKAEVVVLSEDEIFNLFKTSYNALKLGVITVEEHYNTLNTLRQSEHFEKARNRILANLATSN